MKTTALFQLKKLLPVLIFGLFFFSCQKDIDEPKHKNKGRNIIYLKIDEQEFLIKEGFTMNRRVIKSEIAGVGQSTKPTFTEQEYLGKWSCSLVFGFSALNTDPYINLAAWRLGYYRDDHSTVGLLNSIHLEFVSEKHGKRILISDDGYGGPTEYAPQIKILKQDEKNRTISGTLSTPYHDFIDSTLTGDFYMYFDLEY